MPVGIKPDWIHGEIEVEGNQKVANDVLSALSVITARGALKRG